MQCHHCKHLIPDTTSFCGFCGAPLSTNQQSQNIAALENPSLPLEQTRTLEQFNAEISPQYEPPLSTTQYFLMLLLGFIPILGLAFLLIGSLQNKNKTKKNFSQALLLFFLAAIILFFIFFYGFFTGLL